MSYGDGAATEPDPAGVDAGLSVSSVYIPPDDPIPGNKDDLVGGCTMDGAYAPCSLVMKRVNAGAAVGCPNNDCGARTFRDPNTGHPVLAPLTYNPNTGALGYSVPVLGRVDVSVIGAEDAPSWRGQERVIGQRWVTLSSGVNFIGMGFGGFMLGIVPQQTGQQEPQKDPCPPKIRKFFDTALPYFRGMAASLETDPAFLAALSAKETGWGGSRAFRVKNNLFGVSIREKPVSYRSYEASGRAWLRMFGGDVFGAPSMEDFANELKSVGRWERPYNSVDKGDPRTGRKGYYESLMDYHKDVEAWAEICGIKL